MEYAAQKQVVEGLYRLLGLTPSWGTTFAPGSAYVYDGKGVGLRYDAGRPEVALHDAAHYLVSPPERRGLPNFGLGPADHVTERKRAPRVLPEADVLAEEWCATVLHVALAEVMMQGGESVYRKLCLNGRAHGRPQTNHLGFVFPAEEVEMLRARYGIELPRTEGDIRRLVRDRTYLPGA